jgi:hypothetical protein
MIGGKHAEGKKYAALCELWFAPWSAGSRPLSRRSIAVAAALGAEAGRFGRGQATASATVQGARWLPVVLREQPLAVRSGRLQGTRDRASVEQPARVSVPRNEVSMLLDDRQSQISQLQDALRHANASLQAHRDAARAFSERKRLSREVDVLSHLLLMVQAEGTGSTTERSDH